MVSFSYLMEMSFSNWLQKELKEHRMTQAELSRLSGITTAQISRIISESRGIGSVGANAIADALDIPPETVHRAAGLLPPEPKEDPLVKTITYLAEKLPTEEEKQDAAEYIRLRLRIAEERGKHEFANKKRATKT